MKAITAFILLLVTSARGGRPTTRCFSDMKDDPHIPLNLHNRLEAYSGLANWVDSGSGEDYCRKVVARNF